MAKFHKININVDDDVFKAYNEISTALGVPCSVVIREALRTNLKPALIGMRSRYDNALAAAEAAEHAQVD